MISDELKARIRAGLKAEGMLLPGMRAVIVDGESFEIEIRPDGEIVGCKDRSWQIVMPVPDTESMSQRRRLIALDFDGVLHLYDQPWTDDATIADGPTPGAMRFLRSLVEDGRFEVVIVSSRLSSDDGEQAVLVWLDRELTKTFGREVGGRVLDAVRLSATRPPAFLTIDDRAVTFTGVWPDLDAIATFRSWNKRPASGTAEGEAEIDDLIARTATARSALDGHLSLNPDELREIVRDAWAEGNEMHSCLPDETVDGYVDTMMRRVLQRLGGGGRKDEVPAEYDAEAVRIASEGIPVRRYPPATAVDE